jgi:hypothetical protein
MQTAEIMQSAMSEIIRKLVSCRRRLRHAKYVYVPQILNTNEDFDTAHHAAAAACRSETSIKHQLKSPASCDWRQKCIGAVFNTRQCTWPRHRDDRNLMNRPIMKHKNKNKLCGTQATLLALRFISRIMTRQSPAQSVNLYDEDKWKEFRDKTNNYMPMCLKESAGFRSRPHL